MRRLHLIAQRLTQNDYSFSVCTPGVIQTPDLSLRKRTLYPTELQAQILPDNYIRKKLKERAYSKLIRFWRVWAHLSKRVWTGEGW